MCGGIIFVFSKSMDTDFDFIYATAFHLAKKPWKTIGFLRHQEEFLRSVDKFDYLIYNTASEKEGLKHNKEIGDLKHLKLKRIYEFDWEPTYKSILLYKREDAKQKNGV